MTNHLEKALKKITLFHNLVKPLSLLFLKTLNSMNYYHPSIYQQNHASTQKLKAILLNCIFLLKIFSSSIQELDSTNNNSIILFKILKIIFVPEKDVIFQILSAQIDYMIN